MVATGVLLVPVILRLSVTVAVVPSLKVALRMGLKIPEDCGEPEMRPVLELKLRPVGSSPVTVKAVRLLSLEVVTV
jgi:hypothetical protein